MTGQLAGKRALITGSSHGVGLAAAHMFAAQGAEVVLHGNQNMADADQAVQAIGPAALGAIQADLSQPGAGRDLYDAALHMASGRLDIIINNAGIHWASPLDSSDADWERNWATTLQVNLMAVADICRAAIPEMVASGGGSIVNIASRAGYRGEDREHMAYGASKGALLSLTKTIARQWGGDHVYAYALAPGWIDTRMGPQHEADRARAKAEIPIGDLAQPDEIAAMCAFLASGACRSATGSCIDINGASYVR
ncbi:SDR family NAD(P)-dependent oxidoreductase [Maricaulis maris]|uniref:SDR family NAD(P)-dependent oxidoreductase n=1 Tax=Maricaulis maris TaxID=74318 RepID=UPI003B8BF8C3